MCLRMLTLIVDNSAGWHLETNSFHRHVRLIWELGDIDKYFFRKIVFDLISVISECALQYRVSEFDYANIFCCVRPKRPGLLFLKLHIFLYQIEIFVRKKYVSISPRSGAHVGERNLFLSAIRRSYRRPKSACVKSCAKLCCHLKKQKGPGLLVILASHLRTRAGLPRKSATCGLA